MKIHPTIKAGASAVALGLLVMAGCQTGMIRSPSVSESGSPASAAPANVAPASHGPMAPDFTLETASGSRFTLSSMRGKHPVLVNFFATW